MAIALTAVAVPTEEAFGQALISNATSIVARAVPSDEAFGQALVGSATSIVAYAVPSEEAFGAAQYLTIDFPAPAVPGFPGDWAAPPAVYQGTLTLVGGISVTGTTATAQTSTAHGLVVGQLVQLAGIDYPGANFLATVTAIPDSTHFQYEWVV